MYMLKTAIIFVLIIFFRYLRDAGYEDNIVTSENFLTSRGGITKKGTKTDGEGQ